MCNDMGKRNKTVQCDQQQIRNVDEWEDGEAKKHVGGTSLDVLHIVAVDGGEDDDDGDDDLGDEESSPIRLHIF